jgi:hypothetical protein
MLSSMYFLVIWKFETVKLPISRLYKSMFIHELVCSLYISACLIISTTNAWFIFTRPLHSNQKVYSREPQDMQMRHSVSSSRNILYKRILHRWLSGTNHVHTWISLFSIYVCMLNYLHDECLEYANTTHFTSINNISRTNLFLSVFL